VAKARDDILEGINKNQESVDDDLPDFSQDVWDEDEDDQSMNEEEGSNEKSLQSVQQSINSYSVEADSDQVKHGHGPAHGRKDPPRAHKQLRKLG